MANYLDLMSLFEDIGGAINNRGVSGRFYPNQMASAIRAISVGSAINNSALTVTPTTSQQIYNVGSSFTGFGPVTVNAIPDTYIVPNGTYTVSSAGSEINITNYASLNVPSGDFSITYGLQSSSAQVSFDVRTNPVGWINKQAAHTVYLPSTSVSHITPLSTSQVAVSKYRWTLNEVIVDAIPNTYVIPTGILEITANGSYNVANYASISVAIPTGATINNQNVYLETKHYRQYLSGQNLSSGYTGYGNITVDENLNYWYKNEYITPTEEEQTLIPSNYELILTLKKSDNQSEYTFNYDPNSYGSDMFSTLIITGFIQPSVNETPTKHMRIVYANQIETSDDKVVLNFETGYSNIISNSHDVPYLTFDYNNHKVILHDYNFLYDFEIKIYRLSNSDGAELRQFIVNPISSTYIGTGITQRTNSDITITNNTGIVNIPAGYYSLGIGKQLTTQAGTTVNPSTTSQTIVPAFRWTTGSIIVNAMPAPTTSPAINGNAFLATTGDYDFGVTVTIPEGYYSETTISQNFASVYPALGSQASASHILAGKEAYDGLGHIVSGGMTNNGKVTATLTSTTTTYTIPAGYHDGTGTVSHTTVAIPVPTFSMSSTTGTITASGNWTRGFTTNSTYTSTYTLTTRAGATITPTEAQQTAVSAYRWTTGSVLVAAISSTYVGTGIATISSANVTVAGQSVTAPAGYYSSAITKAVTTMTLPTTFPTTSTGTAVATIGRSTATRYLNIPVGYNTTSRFYTISSVPNGIVTAPTTISSTSATLTAGTNTITLAKTISVTPNVTTAGYISSGTAGNANVTLTAAVTTKAASTITPTTASQTAVAANTYVTGAITVAAIPSSYKLLSQTTTATSSTMLESVTAYNSNGELMTGNVHVITYYTGTSAPTSSLGNNGDIYLQTDGR